MHKTKCKQHSLAQDEKKAKSIENDIYTYEV